MAHIGRLHSLTSASAEISSQSRNSGAEAPAPLEEIFCVSDESAILFGRKLELSLKARRFLLHISEEGEVSSSIPIQPVILRGIISEINKETRRAHADIKLPSDFALIKLQGRGFVISASSVREINRLIFKTQKRESSKNTQVHNEPLNEADKDLSPVLPEIIPVAAIVEPILKTPESSEESFSASGLETSQDIQGTEEKTPACELPENISAITSPNENHSARNKQRAFYSGAHLKDDEIIACHKNGKSNKDISDTLGVSYQVVIARIRQYKIKTSPPKPDERPDGYRPMWADEFRQGQDIILSQKTPREIRIEAGKDPLPPFHPIAKAALPVLMSLAAH